MEAEGQAERSVCAEISLNGVAMGSIVEDSLYCRGPNHIPPVLVC